MFNFTIFGIPVSVEPWFWLMAFFMGNGFYELQYGNPMHILIWLLVVFVSILVHELGHALVGRKLGGGASYIRLWAFGGLAYSKGGRFSFRGRRLMILAGPGYGFGLLAVTIIAMLIIWPGQTGLDLVAAALNLWDPGPITQEAYTLIYSYPTKFYLFESLILINLWWGIINLFPVYPLDGGQFIDTFIKSPKRLHLIGMITAGVVIIGGLAFFNSLYMAMLFGYLAFMNYQAYSKAQY